MELSGVSRRLRMGCNSQATASLCLDKSHGKAISLIHSSRSFTLLNTIRSSAHALLALFVLLFPAPPPREQYTHSSPVLFVIRVPQAGTSLAFPLSLPSSAVQQNSPSNHTSVCGQTIPQTLHSALPEPHSFRLTISYQHRRHVSLFPNPGPGDHVTPYNTCPTSTPRSQTPA